MATPNPFAIPTSVNVPTMPTVGLLRRHGSAEQVNRDEGGTYLTAINTPRKTPRSTPRDRSPVNLMDADEQDDGEEEEEYEERQSQRKTPPRRRMPTAPIGIPFRLNATEKSIRELTNEMAAQRIMINQLTEEVQRQAVEAQRQAVGKVAQYQRLMKRFSMLIPNLQKQVI